ncbi:MAG: hypothetical protein OXC71_02790 [Chloroflexi bacterium]|nr:hypothetical protein [Chloroflexota bacterium]
MAWTARPGGRSTEVEFATVLAGEHVEDRLAQLDEQPPVLDEADVSSPGSVIAFGSKRGGWVLDTVLVVADYVDYSAPEAQLALSDEVSEAFLAVTAGPLAGNGDDASLRLYRGATLDDPVDGMFSFFPAMPAGRDAGFERPSVEVDARYFTQTLAQNHKRSCGLGSDVLRSLWEQLATQVCEAGLVLGTHAEQPEQR